MAHLFEMKKERQELLDKAEGIISAAERAGRTMTTDESRMVDTAIAGVHRLNPKIEESERNNTMKAKFFNAKGQLIPGGEQVDASGQKPSYLNREYLAAQHAYIRSRGRDVQAALLDGQDAIDGGFKYVIPSVGSNLYEGSNAAGGFAVPSFVEPQIVPLAPPEMGVESIADVFPTVADLKFPRTTAFGTAASKSESGSSSNAFGGGDPTIDQFTLTANMVGHIETASWELLQDVGVFQSFLTLDILLSIAILKEGYYVSGTGSGQAQGLLGNVGAGVTGETADSSGNLLSIASTFDVMGTLKAYYYNKNTRWLMARATAIELRKAQSQSNLFAPVFVSSGGKDYLHGIEVTYSSSMPAIAAGATPVLLGDFKAGYVIGIRGGGGVNIKILDQPLAQYGQLQILGYQRVDGRVRRSEAIQGITLHT